MIRPSSRISYHNDPWSRLVMRSLLLLQLAAMVIVLTFCLMGLFLPALVISFLTLFVSLAVIGWLYVRYRDLPAVREKRHLTRLVLKFEKNLLTDELHIQTTTRERARLTQAEQEETLAALQVFQKSYIADGLENASIKHAAVQGVGPKLKELLAGNGVLSAAQVSNGLAQLPGFGVEKSNALLLWRSSVVAKLESTKPSALPPEQVESIQQKYQALQEQNNAAEKKAIASQEILEHELMSLKPHVHSLASITLRGYLSRSLASSEMVAALVAFALILTQVVSSVSAILAFAR